MKEYMMKRILAVLLAVGALVLAFPSAATAESGNQRFVVVRSGSIDDPTQRVLAGGTINGVGQLVEAADQPGDEEKNIYRAAFVFPEGSVSIVSTRHVEEFEFDPETCVGSLFVAMTYDITGGTGYFAGATGSGTGETRGKFVARRTSEGCSRTGGRVVIVSRLSGTVAIPGQATG